VRYSQLRARGGADGRPVSQARLPLATQQLEREGGLHLRAVSEAKLSNPRSYHG